MVIPFGIMAAYFATASLMGSGGDVDWRRIFIFLGLTGIALALVVILGIVFLLNKIDFPSPKKDIEKIIPNENFKIVK